MGMNRRGFLGALLGGTAALALDPEKLLWRPGAKLISIPSPRIARASIMEVLDYCSIGIGDYIPSSFVVPQVLVAEVTDCPVR